MILLDNKHVSVEYHKTEACIAYTWKGFVPSKTFRELSEKIIDWITEYKVTKILSDAKEIRAIGMADQEWLVNNFVPKLIASDVQYSAVVVPTSIFGKVSQKNVEEKSNVNESSTILTQYFDNKEEASAWINKY